MKKSQRVEALVTSLAPAESEYSPYYRAFFELFDTGEYYSAHDALEYLWLRESGPDKAFYKGLIQLAGAFVHLKLNRENPSHPTHSRRVAPAGRLFGLSLANLAPYPDLHRGLDLGRVRGLAGRYAATIASDGRNPWTPGSPQLPFDPGGP